MLVYLTACTTAGAVWAVRNVPGPDDLQGRAMKAAVGAGTGLYYAVAGPFLLVAGLADRISDEIRHRN